MKIEKERQEMEAQGGLLSLAESGELGKEPVGEEKKSNLEPGQGMGEVLSKPELTGESGAENEKEQAKGSTPKKEMDEYERRRTDFESRRGFPTIEHLNWDEDIWALDLPKKETIAFLNFRAQKLGMPVEEAIQKTEPKMLEKVAVQIGRGKIENSTEFVTKVSHKEMAIEDRRVLVDLLQMKGPKEKPLAQVAMRLFSYLPMAESGDLKCYKEALEEIMEDDLDDEPEKGQKKKRMTVKELCQGAMREVWREKQVRQQERLWLGADED